MRQAIIVNRSDLAELRAGGELHLTIAGQQICLKYEAGESKLTQPKRRRRRKRSVTPTRIRR